MHPSNSVSTRNPPAHKRHRYSWAELLRRANSQTRQHIEVFLCDCGGQRRLQLGPVVEGTGGRYAVTFAATDVATTPRTGAITGKEIYVERFDWPATATSPTGRPPVPLRSVTSKILEASGLGFDTATRSHWCVGYRQTSPAAVYGVRVGYDGRPTEGPSLLYSVPGDSTTGVACTFNATAHEFQFAYGTRNLGGQAIYGHTMQYVAAPSITLSGQSCNPATVAWSTAGGSGPHPLTSQQIGSEFTQFAITGTTPFAGLVPFVSLAPIDVPLALPVVRSGCRLLVDPNAGFTLPVMVGSGGHWMVPLPESMPPLTLHFQGWLFEGGLFSSTPRLSVPLVR